MFGVLTSFVFDNEYFFSSLKMIEFFQDKGFNIKFSGNYYPQGNGLAKSTNKNSIQIIKKTIQKHHRNCHKSLSNALWDNGVTPKRE